jgi:hypothetical protein
MPDLLEFDMRHVRHLVGGDNGVDNRRAIDGESLLDRPSARSAFAP